MGCALWAKGVGHTFWRCRKAFWARRFFSRHASALGTECDLSCKQSSSQHPQNKLSECSCNAEKVEFWKSCAATTAFNRSGHVCYP